MAQLFYRIDNGEYEKFYCINNFEPTPILEESKEVFEIAYTTEIAGWKWNMLFIYKLFQMSSASNNWLKMNGIPMRRRHGRNK